MSLKKLLIINLFFLFNILIINNSIADNHNIYETLESIQKDIKTLEKAVYSGSVEANNQSLDNASFNNN